MQKLRNEELGRMTPEEYATLTKLPVVVVLDNVRSMNNVGSFFRSCDSFAVERLILCGITGAPPAAEIHKTALGAEQTVPWEYCEQSAEALEGLIEEGYILVAVEQVAESTMLQDFVLGKANKYALVFGNEVDGVSQPALDLCKKAIEIPQAGTKHSLNVAVAGGIVLWHFYSTPWVGR